MKIFAIDPGTTHSAWIIYDSSGYAYGFGKWQNDRVKSILSVNKDHCEFLAIEMIASYGMPVGREIFQTCLWIGRFVEAWNKPYKLIYRKDIKKHLCRGNKVKDTDIRAALQKRFGRVVTDGVTADVWSALAVAVTYCDQLTQRPDAKLAPAFQTPSLF